MRAILQINTILVIVIVLSLGLIEISDCEQLDKNKKISSIPKKDIKYGCGCSYRSIGAADDQLVFMSDLGFESPKMNIDGQTIKLIPMKVEDVPKNAKLGDMFLQIYRYEEIELTFDNVINFVCQPDDEGCEVIRFDSKLTIIDGSKKEIYQVQGDCGC